MMVARLNGAEKRTRTSTVLPPLGPEPSASTNSAISAFRVADSKAKRLICQLISLFDAH